jgi:hypothetical protein
LDQIHKKDLATKLGRKIATVREMEQILSLFQQHLPLSRELFFPHVEENILLEKLRLKSENNKHDPIHFIEMHSRLTYMAQPKYAQ